MLDISYTKTVAGPGGYLVVPSWSSPPIRSVDLPSSEKTLELQEQIDKLEGAMARPAKGWR